MVVFTELVMATLDVDDADDVAEDDATIIGALGATVVDVDDVA
jgi:hypothetical protein